MKKIISILLFGALCIYAENLQIGSSIEILNNYKYETPQSDKIKIPVDTKTILITFNKNISELVNEYLSEKDESYLHDHKAVYISDINKMPTIITKLFALPALRDFKHTIYLHYEEEFQHNVPKKEEKITLIKFKDKKVETISFISTKEELSRIF